MTSVGVKCHGQTASAGAFCELMPSGVKRTGNIRGFLCRTFKKKPSWRLLFDDLGYRFLTSGTSAGAALPWSQSSATCVSVGPKQSFTVLQQTQFYAAYSASCAARNGGVSVARRPPPP